MHFYVITSKKDRFLVKSEKPIETVMESGTGTISFNSIMDLRPSTKAKQSSLKIKAAHRVSALTGDNETYYVIMVSSISSVDAITPEQFNALGLQITVANGLLRNI